MNKLASNMTRNAVNFLLAVVGGTIVLLILLMPYSLILVPSLVRGKISPFYVSSYMWAIHFIVGFIVATISKISPWPSLTGVVILIFLILFSFGARADTLKNLLSITSIFAVVSIFCGGYFGYLVKKFRTKKAHSKM